MFDTLHFGGLSNSEIWDLLEKEVNALYHPWKASIPFEVYVISDSSTVITNDLLNGSLKLVDICDYLDGAKYPVYRLYFCRSTYPPPLQDSSMDGSSSESCAGWVSLRRDLCKSAFNDGNLVFSNGSSGCLGRQFKCSCSRHTSLPEPNFTTPHTTFVY